MLRPLFALCLLLSARVVFAGTEATLYVSPSGSGADFSLAQPGNLFDAQSYIRTLDTNMTGDIVVYLLGGTYQLTNSFQLQENSTNHDSGTGGFNIIYENYPGQTPIISGGMVVTNWSLFDPVTNIWSAFVGTGVNSRQLYVNGLRAIRARGPGSIRPASSPIPPGRVFGRQTPRCNFGATRRTSKSCIGIHGSNCVVPLLPSPARTSSCRRRAGRIR